MATAVIAQHSRPDLAAEVRAGLCRPGQKELPSKYLYDEIGSALFEVVSVLPEYGLTRADERLLQRHAADIVSRLKPHVLVAELGSGSGKKTRWLLEALARRQRTTYCPIEISPTALARCENELGRIECVSIVGFERPYLDGLLAAAARRGKDDQLLVLFLGSTIGNFDRDAAERFLTEVRRTCFPATRSFSARTSKSRSRNCWRPMTIPSGQPRPSISIFSRASTVSWARTSIFQRSTMKRATTPRTSGSKCICVQCAIRLSPSRARGAPYLS